MCGRTSLFVPQSVLEDQFDATAIEPYGVRSVPSTIVLDEEGSVVSKSDGLTQADEIVNAL